MGISSRSVSSAFGLYDFARRDRLPLARPEGGVLHPERAEEAPVQEFLVGHAADDFDDAAGGVDAGVGVLVAGVRLELERHRGVACRRHAQRQQVQRGRFHGRTERQAAGVAEDVAHRDGMPRLSEQHVIGILLDAKPLALEFGQVRFHEVVQAHLAFVHEHHERRGGDRLALRGHPEERIRTHRLAGGDVGEAGRLDGAHFVPVRHQHHGAGHPALVNERLQRRCESPAARNTSCHRRSTSLDKDARPNCEIGTCIFIK